MIDTILDLIISFANWVLALLPTSPFVSFIDSFEELPYLGWLNWFVPIGSIIAVCEAWLISIGLFYLYSIVLRWIRAID